MKHEYIDRSFQELILDTTSSLVSSNGRTPLLGYKHIDRIRKITSENDDNDDLSVGWALQSNALLNYDFKYPEDFSVVFRIYPIPVSNRNERVIFSDYEKPFDNTNPGYNIKLIDNDDSSYTLFIIDENGYTSIITIMNNSGKQTTSMKIVFKRSVNTVHIFVNGDLYMSKEYGLSFKTNDILSIGQNAGHLFSEFYVENLNKRTINTEVPFFHHKIDKIMRDPYNNHNNIDHAEEVKDELKLEYSSNMKHIDVGDWTKVTSKRKSDAKRLDKRTSDDGFSYSTTGKEELTIKFIVKDVQGVESFGVCVHNVSNTNNGGYSTFQCNIKNCSVINSTGNIVSRSITHLEADLYQFEMKVNKILKTDLVYVYFQTDILLTNKEFRFKDLSII